MMADASNLTVVIESAIHDALAQVAQHAAREHGIFIKSVEFEWIESFRFDTTNEHHLARIRVNTASTVPRRGEQR